MKLTEQYLNLFNKCNPNELSRIIDKYFSFAYHDSNEKSEKNKIVYERSQNEIKDTLTIEYYSPNNDNKKNRGKIRDVGYTNKEILDEIINHIEQDLFPIVPKFSHCVIYTSEYFKKEYFRYSNKILIRPVDSSIRESLLDKLYPAILEFYYNGSNDWQIDALRLERTKAELVWMLSVLFRFTIKVDNENTAGKEYYGYYMTSKENGFVQSDNLIFRKGYIINDFKPILNDLNASGLDGNILIERLNLHTVGETDVPSYLSDTMQKDFSIACYTNDALKVFFLNNNKNEGFLRASYWFHQASDNFENKSNVIVWLATALECLIDKSSKKCNECCQVNYSISKKVKEIVSKYYNDLLKNKDKDLLDLIDHFYAVRSDIVHGNKLPLTDIPNQRGFDPIINKINNNIQYYIFIVRLVILNWYLDGLLDSEIPDIKKVNWHGISVKTTFTFTS